MALRLAAAIFPALLAGAAGLIALPAARRRRSRPSDHRPVGVAAKVGRFVLDCAAAADKAGILQQEDRNG
jgi:hypothetical protein